MMHEDTVFMFAGPAVPAIEGNLYFEFIDPGVSRAVWFDKYCPFIARQGTQLPFLEAIAIHECVKAHIQTANVEGQ